MVQNFLHVKKKKVMKENYFLSITGVSNSRPLELLSAAPETILKLRMNFGSIGLFFGNFLAYSTSVLMKAGRCDAASGSDVEAQVNISKYKKTSGEL